MKEHLSEKFPPVSNFLFIHEWNWIKPVSWKKIEKDKRLEKNLFEAFIWKKKLNLNGR